MGTELEVSSLKWYRFRQNNSGGVFHQDARAGISVEVIIQARDGQEANYRAERIGLYFDGCETGQDCNCCGDRWSSVMADSTWETVDAPPADGLTWVKDFDAGHIFKWMKPGVPETYVHPFLDPFYGSNL